MQFCKFFHLPQAECYLKDEYALRATLALVFHLLLWSYACSLSYLQSAYLLCPYIMPCLGWLMESFILNF
jgi:hypothetical protein